MRESADKNTIIGLLLMGLVFVGYMWSVAPSAEELEQQRQAQKAKQDSIAALQNQPAAPEATPVNNILSFFSHLLRNPEYRPLAFLRVEFFAKTLSFLLLCLGDCLL